MSGSAPRRVVVLRHGETTHNLAGIWQGQLDSELTDLGREQADAVGPAIARLAPVRVLSSDLNRARATAESIGRATGVAVELDPRLREIHAGAWQGLTSDEVTAGWPEAQAALRRGEDIRRGDTGESMADVLARVGETADEVLAGARPGECIVFSTHGVAGKALTAYLLGIEQHLAWRVLGTLGNCHWAELVEGREGWRIRTWNESAGTASRPGTSPPVTSSP